MARLRAATGALHVRAEKSGIVRDILRGDAERHGYTLFLQNLLPAYDALEAGLSRRRAQPAFKAFTPALHRAAALRADLAVLNHGARNRTSDTMPAAADYARRIAEAAEDDGPRLLGHVYVRYMGDLNGGQILSRLLTRSLGLGPDALNFYAFPLIPDLGACKAELARAFDDGGADEAGMDAIVAEAVVAFDLNIRVSEAVREAAQPGTRPAPADPRRP